MASRKASRTYTPGCTSTFELRLPRRDDSASGVVVAGGESAEVHSAAQHRRRICSPLPRIPKRCATTRAAARVDANTRFGQLSGYYFVDNYRAGQSLSGRPGRSQRTGLRCPDHRPGADVHDRRYQGARAQRPSTSFTSAFCEMRIISASRTAGSGVSLQSQGFVTGVGTPGIVVQAPQFEGVENIVFPSFVMGVPVTNVDQWNNTLYLSDTISKVIGAHTLEVRRPVPRRPGQRRSQCDVQRNI